MIRDPESILAADDAAAYRRFLDWSPGSGFDLAIVKVTLPAKRDALIAWTKEQIPKAVEIDLRQVAPSRSRLWDLLNAAVRDQGATVLIAYGLEQALDPARILAQLNVERDELVKAFALPWILFVHPSVYADVVHKAPDFVDFAGLWLDEAQSDVLAESPVVMPEVRAKESIPLAEEASGKKDLLNEAALAIAGWHLDEARDLLAQYGMRRSDTSHEEPDDILARCLRAFAGDQLPEALRILREEWLPVVKDLEPVRALTMAQVALILRTRGALSEALSILRENVLPVFERLGDMRWKAMTLLQVADILEARGELQEALRVIREELLPSVKESNDARLRATAQGELAEILQALGQWDEALRLLREDVLPVYERLGDVHSRALMLGNVADILFARGDYDEALRIRREEELPAYERFGDVRSRAITLGKVADILFTRGDYDEALRIRLEEELPVYESLGDARSLVIGRVNLAMTLGKRGRAEDVPQIVQLLIVALADARRLRLPDALQIEAIIRRVGLDPNAPPFV